MLPDRIEIRVTRPGYYSRDCTNPKYQQGYFFTGVDYQEAKQKAQTQFPHEPLTLQITRKLINGTWVQL